MPNNKKPTKSTPKVNRKRSRPSSSPLQSTSKTCFVELTDIMSTSSNPKDLPDSPIHEVKTEVSELRAKLNNLENLINPLLPLIPLLSPTTTPTSADLIKAAHLVDSLSSEISRRLKCERQILVHNVPDKFPCEKAKQAVLSTCGLNTAKCRAVRLKKSSPALCCPIMLEFETPYEAQTIYSHRELLKSHPKLVNAKVCQAQTHLQRETMKTCLSNTPETSSKPISNLTYDLAPQVNDGQPSLSPPQCSSPRPETPSSEQVVDSGLSGFCPHNFFRKSNKGLLGEAPLQQGTGSKPKVNKPKKFANRSNTAIKSTLWTTPVAGDSSECDPFRILPTKARPPPAHTQLRLPTVTPPAQPPNGHLAAPPLNPLLLVLQGLSLLSSMTLLSPPFYRPPFL